MLHTPRSQEVSNPLNGFCNQGHARRSTGWRHRRLHRNPRPSPITVEAPPSFQGPDVHAGIGIRTGALILIDVGTAFPSAAYADLAPATRKLRVLHPGRTALTEGKRAGQRDLLPLHARRPDRPASRTYYNKKVAQGKHHTQAIFCLARAPSRRALHNAPRRHLLPTTKPHHPLTKVIGAPPHTGGVVGSPPTRSGGNGVTPDVASHRLTVRGRRYARLLQDQERVGHDGQRIDQCRQSPQRRRPDR